MMKTIMKVIGAIVISAVVLFFAFMYGCNAIYTYNERTGKAPWIENIISTKTVVTIDECTVTLGN